MSKEQLQTNNSELGGNNTELNDILQTINDNLIDLTGDTVTAETLAEGVTAHGANGERLVGTMRSADDIVLPDAVLYTEQSLSDAQKEQARENISAAPAYTYGTADITAGSSSLGNGKLYFVYE